MPRLRWPGMVPIWLHDLAIAWLALGFLCAAVIAADELRHPQQMAIMNLVWPVDALFGTGLVLWAYFRYGRLATREAAAQAKREGRDPPSKTRTPFAAMVGKGAAHCGAGCTLGDICAEWLAVWFPGIAVALGAHAFGDKLFAVWVLDYLLAYGFGIAFQYFTIAPMRGLGLWAGLWQAVKADTLSLTAWQVGMYGYMAFAALYLFGTLIGVRMAADTVEFWFMMQIAMLCGFATSYPVNSWLLRIGVKETM